MSWYLRRADAELQRERYWRRIRDGKCTRCGKVDTEQVLCTDCAWKRKLYREGRGTT